MTNPYSPGAGARPPALEGRDDELEAWEVALGRACKGKSARSLVLFGLRGVGKTVLLTEMATHAEREGWIVAQIESAAGASLRSALSSTLQPHLARLARRGKGKKMLRALKTALSFSAKVDVDGSTTFGLNLGDIEAELADSGDIELDLATLVDELADAAHDSGTGIAVLIDEAQDLTPDELTAICSVAHRASQRLTPALFVLAGLPSLPSKLADAKSYSERLFRFLDIRELDEEAARAALIVPARAEGVEWDARALELVVEATGRYPYFLPEHGSESWLEATTSPITEADTIAGGLSAQEHLDTGFYRMRWDRATKAEQDYLRAMAADGDRPSRTADVASRLGRTSKQLSTARQKLTDKGLVYAPEYGTIAFTVPGMAAFIHRQH